MRDAFISAITEIAEADKRVALITGDLGFGVLKEFSERFPNQFINAGVAEQNMTAIAAGMALSGWKVYTYSIANFATLRCLEQIRNDVCYHNANVTVISIGGGFSYGQLGMSHFATEDLAIMRALPNIDIVAPSEKWEAVDLAHALYARSGPAYVRIDKGEGGVDRRPGETAELGKARTVREGKAISLFAIGAIVSEAVKAADMLAGEGIDARVVSFSTLKPLDEEVILSAARETGGIITIEEHMRAGGLGGAVGEVCLDHGAAPRAFVRVGLNDAFPTVVGDQPYLRNEYAMNAEAIAGHARKMLGGI